LSTMEVKDNFPSYGSISSVQKISFYSTFTNTLGFTVAPLDILLRIEVPHFTQIFDGSSPQQDFTTGAGGED